MLGQGVGRHDLKGNTNHALPLRARGDGSRDEARRLAVLGAGCGRHSEKFALPRRALLPVPFDCQTNFSLRRRDANRAALVKPKFTEPFSPQPDHRNSARGWTVGIAQPCDGDATGCGLPQWKAEQVFDEVRESHDHTYVAWSPGRRLFLRSPLRSARAAVAWRGYAANPARWAGGVEEGVVAKGLGADVIAPLCASPVGPVRRYRGPLFALSNPLVLVERAICMEFGEVVQGVQLCLSRPALT